MSQTGKSETFPGNGKAEDIVNILTDVGIDIENERLGPNIIYG